MTFFAVAFGIAFGFAAWRSSAAGFGLMVMVALALAYFSGRFFGRGQYQHQHQEQSQAQGQTQAVHLYVGGEAGAPLAGRADPVPLQIVRQLGGESANHLDRLEAARVGSEVHDFASEAFQNDQIAALVERKQFVESEATQEADEGWFHDR